MTHRSLLIARNILIYFVIPILTVLSVLNILSQGLIVSKSGESRLAPGSLAQADTIDSQGTYPDSEAHSIGNTNFRGDSDEKFPFHLYVTPQNAVIKDIAATISGPEEAYQTAKQWIYVSDEKLNGIADNWLTPHEFLYNTRSYPNNPLKGISVSDCEEQANSLASLLRAIGIQPENVRVVVGEVIFNDTKMGHVWVELLVNQKWLVLDATSGPYWDDSTGTLVERNGTPFDNYASQTYPVVQTWVYYNDIYYLNSEAGSGDAPVFWYHQLSEEEDADSSRAFRTQVVSIVNDY